eukprot:TRINITY_DN57_c0_g2_i1.p1 TRINITY_DN57_c0_g2~~TRINITY_DN57_c0_g2_i1.p1  ORF type:complete len:153 (-),score=13.86 TRINITY_DN57_c0_g2_i1:140-598(-)
MRRDDPGFLSVDVVIVQRSEAWRGQLLTDSHNTKSSYVQQSPRTPLPSTNQPLLTKEGPTLLPVRAQMWSSDSVAKLFRWCVIAQPDMIWDMRRKAAKPSQRVHGCCSKLFVALGARTSIAVQSCFQTEAIRQNQSCCLVGHNYARDMHHGI